MSLDPAPRDSACVALLDDMTAGASSRLYTGHIGTLSITDPAALPAAMDEAQALLARGMHAVGVFTYELGARMQGVQADCGDGPLAQVLLFERHRKLDEAQVLDWLASQGRTPAGVANVRAALTQPQFEAAVRRIQGFIAAGDTYQVNFTWPFEFDAYGDPASLYLRLRARQRVPYGAFIVLPGGGAVLSLSPELFVRHTAGELVARPMKGTAPASQDDAENAVRAQALAADAKNRAENVMIVDLMRSDLGRIAKQGTVHVPALFDVERYGGVLQMTSTVRARIDAHRTLADIFHAIYPCGSITGAPKRRTMQIIGELESSPRGIYTGGIGWFEPPAPGRSLGDFCISVPIRTLVLKPPHAPHDGVRAGRMGVGSGIVADSDPRAEWDECRLKAQFLTGLAHEFELFETMRATREEGCALLAHHLSRLAASAASFGMPLDTDGLAEAVRAACATLEAGKVHRLRVALAPTGTWTLQAAAQQPVPAVVRVFIAEEAIDETDLFLRHKTTVRAQLDAAWQAAQARGGFDSLFFNRRGELAQGGRTNVFVKLGGRWFTPPLACGALPGVMRSVLLADARWAAAERVIMREELQRCEEIVVCNALRGAMRATLHDMEAAIERG